MKIYISGPITGIDNYKDAFLQGERDMREMGNIPYSPARIDLPYEASHEEYMTVDMALLDLCEGIYLLKGWETSPGANRELGYALAKGYTVILQDNYKGGGNDHQGAAEED